MAVTESSPPADTTHDVLAPPRAGTDTAGAGFGTRGWMVLITLCCATFMCGLDFSIVTVALPDIGKGLGFSSTGNLQWVATASLLPSASLLPLFARVSERRVGGPTQRSRRHPHHGHGHRTSTTTGGTGRRNLPGSPRLRTARSHRLQHHSRGERLLAFGNAFHSPLQIRHPDWSPSPSPHQARPLRHHLVAALVVLSRQVGDAAGWGLALDAGVGSVVVVPVDPVGECGLSFGV